MKTFLQPIHALEEINSIKEHLKKRETPLYVSGCIDSQKCHLIYGLGGPYTQKIIITYNEIRAKEIYEDMRFFGHNVYLYPAKDIIFYSADVQSNYIVSQRLQVLKSIIEDEEATIILTIDAVLDHLLPLEAFRRHIMAIEVGQVIDLEELKAQLIYMGYERTELVQAQGQFSIRGGILDIYDLTEETAYRIELWDDEVDSIRLMDVASQRSTDKVNQMKIYPASEVVLGEKEIKQAVLQIEDEKEKLVRSFREKKDIEALTQLEYMVEEVKEKFTELKNFNGVESYLHFFSKETCSLLDYFESEKTLFFLDEPVRLQEKYEGLYHEFRESMMSRLEKGYLLPSQLKVIFSYDELCHQLSKKSVLLLSTLTQNIKGLPVKEHYNLLTKSINPYNNSFEMLIKDLKFWKEKRYKVILLAGSKLRAERLTKDLLEREIHAKRTVDFSEVPKEGEVLVGYGNLHKGFEYPLIQYAVISESDVFGKSKKKRIKQKKYQGKKIQSFTDLTIGDYVVHENHGLGIFQGIEKIEVEGIAKDYIKITYREGGNLYISTSQLEAIQKYIGAEGRKPKLNKLGSSEWQKTKTKVKGAVKDLAKELVSLYAKRQERKGYQYTEDTIWQKEFEEMFPYEETEDQLSAIIDTKKDMESMKIMDRLICGDVGYGKTEVAIRAAFKAVQEGKQVAYLVPTTILAQQHYNNFVQRMKDFPVRVEMMSRFRSAKEQKQTIEGLRKGMVDIVIGTHRIISKDIKFKDLGLLIVDEEQRFGVSHKEKIKQLKDDVDVLTLTATPIPRTLHMSLIGIRDMSVLEEPPEERLPIQTYVMEFNDEMVREAIHRELAREGQVYYVHNRVKNIDEVADKISKMVPDANVAFAHGQMNERELEQIMFEFINGEIDVLVSTTIIETGLDISNVNTIIIQDADHMGLSQLYQLRGRVGRSNRVAYAYLCYKRNKVLKETAEKRLQAIREFTEFGSGFKIAMRDLEIRGAGNLLGAQQHGHMEAVGYDMYCKMLDQAIRALKEDKVEDGFETTIDLTIDAYIPVSYIRNEVQKLDVYKRIATIENEEDYFAMQEELEDRYGNLPNVVQNLLDIAYIKALAHQVDINAIEQKQKELHLYIRENANIDPAKIPELIRSLDNQLAFKVGEKPCFILKLNPSSKSEFFRQIKNVLHQLNCLKA